MRFCGNCGTQLADDALFCAACGSAQEVAQAASTVQQPQPNPGYYEQPAGNVHAGKLISDWDGGVLETFAAMIVTSLITTFTCGIGTPWAICYLWKFILGHAVIDGQRLTFDGNGAQLLGNWIKWFLLTLITCGIYGFWVYPKLFKWVASHTHVA